MAGWRSSGSSPAPSCAAGDSVPNGFSPKTIISDRKNVVMSTLFYQLSRRRPKIAKSLIRKAAMKQLPPGYDVDTHFRPRYQPWDQRLCLIPDGDLFRAIRHGRASVVTDQIAEFTEWLPEWLLRNQLVR